MSHGLVEDRPRDARASVAHPSRTVRGIYAAGSGLFVNGVPAYFARTTRRDEHLGDYRFYLTVSHTDAAVYGQSSAKEVVENRTALFERLADRLGLASLEGRIVRAGFEREAAWNEGVGRSMLRMLARLEPDADDLKLVDAAGWTYVSFETLEKGA